MDDDTDEASVPHDDAYWELALRDDDAAAASTGRNRRGRVGLLATGVVVLGALAVLVLLRPTAPAPLTGAPIRGVWMRVGDGQIVATYRVSDDPRGARYHLDAVTGPALAGGAPQTVATRSA
jgi:hypothetical protein